MGTGHRCLIALISICLCNFSLCSRFNSTSLFHLLTRLLHPPSTPFTRSHSVVFLLQSSRFSEMQKSTQRSAVAAIRNACNERHLYAVFVREKTANKIYSPRRQKRRTYYMKYHLVTLSIAFSLCAITPLLY